MSGALRGWVAAARLGGRRARLAPGRWAPVASTLALAIAGLGALAASGVVAGDGAARAALARLGPGDARVGLAWSGGAGPAVDAAARRALAAGGAGRVTRGLLLQPARFGRADVRLAGVDPAAPALRMLAGRLPHGPCRPRSCEVVRLAGAPAPGRLAARGVTLVVVGRAALADPTALGFTTTPADSARTARGAVLLATNDPAGLEALPATAAVARTHGWNAPLALGRLHAWQLPAALGRLATVRRRLEARTGGFTMTAPEEALRAARAAAEAAPGRLVGAGAGALTALGAFLVLAAAALRASARSEDARLRSAGATRAQRAALALAETAVPVGTGLAGGLLCGAAVAVLRARAGGLDAGEVLRATAAAALPRAAAAAAAAWLLVLAVVTIADRRAARAAAAALVAAAAAVVALLGTRETDGSRPLPLGLVPVAALTGALLVALALPGVLRALAGRWPARRPLARLALAELAREPGLPAVAAAGMAASVALGTFALSYHATLVASQQQRAIQRVALTATLQAGRSLRSPATAHAPGFWAAATGARPVPVLRRDAFATAGPTRTPVTIVGLPAATLAALAGVQPAGARAAAPLLAAAPFGGRPAGVALPAGARVVRLFARATGDAAALTLLVRTASGALDPVAAGLARAGRRALAVALARGDRGGRIEAIGVRPPLGLDVTQAHQLAEGGAGPASSGSVSLGPLVLAGRRISLRVWRGHGGVGGPAGGLHHDPSSGSDGLVRPATPSDRAALPVLADPATAREAAATGTVAIESGGASVRARVVGLIRRLPTVPDGSPVIVGDVRALGGALDAQAPGAGVASELWLAAPAAGSARADAAAAAIARREGFLLATRDAVRRALARDPVEREALRGVTLAAVMAALLALGGTVLMVRRGLREGADGLRDLEAQGVGPAGLRRGLALRAGIVAGAGVPAGLVLGAALTVLAAGAARAALASPPDPPLAAIVPWGEIALLGLGLLAATVAAGVLVAAPALREPLAEAGRELPVSVVCRELFRVHRTAEGDAAALQGLSLEASAGELLAVLGPSGSGKSTLLRVIAGLERPSAGTVLVAGQDLGRLRGRRRAAARRALVGLVGQHADAALPPDLAILDAVALPLRLRGAPRREAAGRAAHVLARMGLSDVAFARPHELSGGERQRAAVCVAVVHRPPVVLADEPTGELDAAAAGAVLELLRELAEGDGATVVLVTHDPIGARSAHRVVRIRDGRVSQEGEGSGRTVVVGQGGWLHVSEELLARAGIGRRARVRAEPGAVVLEPAGPAAAAAPSPRPRAPGAAVTPVAAELRAVAKRFGERTVLTGLTAAFAPGTMTAVTGRSGSGKSTLLALLAGLQLPDAGLAVVAGEDLAGLNREALAALRRQRVGYVAQELRLAAFLTAAEQVALAPRLAGSGAEEADATARSWLTVVGLAERQGQRVGRLSAGERQRVALARALAGGRGLLLVDEPTSRLDERAAAAVAALLAGLAAEHGATVVCATHDPVVAAAAGTTLALEPAPGPA